VFGTRSSYELIARMHLEAMIIGKPIPHVSPQFKYPHGVLVEGDKGCGAEAI